MLEGIMMKNKSQYSVAVRRPDGEIEVKTDEYVGIAGDKAWAKLPLIRGMVNFIDSMILGMKTLSWSASFYEDEEEEAKPGKFEKFLLKLFGEKAEKVVMGATVAFSVIMAVLIFMLLPYFLSGLFRKFIVSNTLLAIVEGCFGVAENGAVWITQQVKFKALYFIPTALVIIINKDALVNNMHEAYRQLEGTDYKYGFFVSGPSKTADIEQALVLGAHGPMKVLVVLKEG